MCCYRPSAAEKNGKAHLIRRISVQTLYAINLTNAMDFVEKLFHISPDGGSGEYEALIVAAAGALILAIALRGYFRKKRTIKK
jgi:hypothetical protein